MIFSYMFQKIRIVGKRLSAETTLNLCLKLIMNKRMVPFNTVFPFKNFTTHITGKQDTSMMMPNVFL